MASGNQHIRRFALRMDVEHRVNTLLLLLGPVPHVSAMHFFTGVVASTNFPGAYPNNLVKTETIQVESGLRMQLTFTAFNLDYTYSSCYDFLTIR